MTVHYRLNNMKRQTLALAVSLLITLCSLAAGLLPSFPLCLALEDSPMKQQISNSLDYMMANNKTYLSNPMLVSLWVMSKSFLNESGNKTELVNYFDSMQDSDGAWSSTWTRMFTTNRVLSAYFLMNATPAHSLDEFFDKYDTWAEARNYSATTGSRDARNMYHLIFAWVQYYWEYPPWINTFFTELEKTDLSWTSDSDFHERTHILYSYIMARRPFPNLDEIIDATISAQMPNGKWDGSQYNFYSTHGDVYFTSIQISLLSEILTLYPGYRTAEIMSSLRKAQYWTATSYRTEVLNGTTYGYFGNVSGIEFSIFCGLLCAGQTGLLQTNIDMTFQSVVDQIVPEFPSAILFFILVATSVFSISVRNIRIRARKG